MNDLAKNLLLWVVVAVVLMVVFQSFSPKLAGAPQEIIYSQFIADVEADRIRKVDIASDERTVKFERSDGSTGSTTAPVRDKDLINDLIEHKVEIKQAPPDTGISFWSIVLNFLPVLLIIGFWLFMMRQMQGGGAGGKGAMSFGRSRAKMLTEDQTKVTFGDVAGCDEAKEEVAELVEFLRDPSRFQKLGGKIPRGVLMVGPPGTGKTLLAKAIAGEAKVPFFSISGSDFVEMFVGVGASRVRDMFEQAKKHAPCIIFIDEIDAVGRHRGSGMGGGHDEREQTLNQMLVEMDGFEGGEGVIVIAATNRPDVLDKALLRPGRFDRQITVGRPDIEGRVRILQVHMRKVPLAPDVDPRVIARGTPGFSGADLANLVNEAALLAARRAKRMVGMVEFEDAKDKVMMGVERKSMVMTEDEKKLTAYHEAGHAVVSLHETASDPIHKATIIPRGRALGMVMRLPERDSYSFHRDKMYANLSVAMGGRVAEELIFGHDKVTSGASSDIQMATNLAKAMVTQWGMSDKLGPLQYTENQEEVFLGHSVSRQQNISEKTAELIDAEVKRLVIAGYDRAKQLLTDHADELEAVAQALLEYETLSGDEIIKVIKGEAVERPNAADKLPPLGSGGVSGLPKAGRRRGSGLGDVAPQA